MKQSNKILIVLFAFLVVTVLVVFLNDKTGPIADVKAKKKPNASYASDQWNKSFKLNEHNAFDLYMFDQLLESTNNLERKVIFNASDFYEVCDDSAALFLFVGDHLILKQSDIDKLMFSVSKGSTLFLSASSFAKNITQIHQEGDVDFKFIYSHLFRITGKNLNLSFSSTFQNDTIADLFSVLTLYPDEEEVTQINGYTNTKIVNIGKGKIIWNSSPLLFTNYYLEKKEGFDHFQYIVSRLPKLKKVWLELPKNTTVKNDFDPIKTPYDKDNLKDYKKDLKNTGTPKQDSELLRMIFSNPSLTFAYFLTILGVILFLLFRTKRMRPHVKVLAEKEDGTKNYTETLARIYQTKSDEFALVVLLHENFYTQIKRSFSIDLNDLSLTNISNLSERSNSSVEEINVLISGFSPLTNTLVNQEYVYKLSAKKTLFYQKAGIVPISKQISEKNNFVLRRSLVLPSILMFIATTVGFLGLFLISSKYGFGIIFIILSFALFGIAIQMFGRLEILRSKQGKLIFYRLFQKPLVLSWENLLRFDDANSKLNFEFKSLKISISKVDIAKIDRHLVGLFQSSSI